MRAVVARLLYLTTTSTIVYLMLRESVDTYSAVCIATLVGVGGATVIEAVVAVLRRTDGMSTDTPAGEPVGLFTQLGQWLDYFRGGELDNRGFFEQRTRGVNPPYDPLRHGPRPPPPQGSGGPSNAATLANVRAAQEVLRGPTRLSTEERTRVIDLNGDANADHGA